MSELENTIWVMIQETVEDTAKSVLPSIGRKLASKSVEITNNVLAKSLEAFFNNFKEVLSQLPRETEGFGIEEIQLTLAINASGAVELIGKAEAGVTTGLNITLKRIRS